MAKIGFDATQHSTDQSVTLPLGIYELEVSKTDVKETKAKTGHVLALTYDVLAPASQKGRQFFDNVNIANDNPTAQKIGQEQLAKLCRSMGISAVDDSDELRFHRFTVKVGLEKPQPGYDQKNKITRYYYPDEGDLPEAKIDDAPANDNRASANDNKPASRPAASTPAKAGGSLPWAKK